MADIDFKVNVDIETTGKNEVDALEKQIENLKKASPIKLDIDITGDGANIAKYFANIQKQVQAAGKGIGRNLGQLISSSAEQAISNVSSTGINKYFKVSASDSNAFRKEMDKLVSSWTNGKGKLTDVKIQTRTSYDADADENIERLHQAQVTYNNALGETIKKTIAWRRIGTTQNAKGEDIPLRGFVEVSSQYSKSLDTAKVKTDNFVKQQKQAASNLKNTVNQISANALDKNASKAIKNDANRQKIENQVNTIRQAITELENANSSTFTDAQIKVKDEISNLKILVKEMQNAESTATALRSKPIEVVKDETLKKVKGLEADIKKAGVTSTDLENYVTQMNTALGNPNVDASGINDVLNIYAKARAELGSLKKEVSADSSLEKAKIKAEGLISEINKASADNSGLSSWKTTINGVETSVNSLVTELGNVKTAGDVSVISEKWKTFSNEAKSAGVIASKSFTQLDATTASNKTLSWLKNNSKAAKDYGDVLTDLANRQRLATSADELKDYTKQVNAIKAEATALGKTGKSFGDEFSRAFKQIGQFAGIYGVIHQIPQIINQMYQEVVKVNTAQVELLKVSDAPTSQLTAYWDEAAESAKKYGAAISDVISSTADWSRLGYNLQDAKKLSDATTLLQRVGDNMTQESSSQGLISTLRGFSMQADEVNKIVDIANQVANTQPIDTSGLFEGLENSASSLSAANNSLEQSIGLITAANSVLQDPSSVGTGLKTISMRVRGASTELEKAGLDTDGMAESVAKLREEIKALSGVDIMIDDNNFKSTFDILDELSVKWKDLTDIQRASVTELIAGKRNGNLVSALMQNFDIARETLNTAINESEGSAEKELANWQKSIQYSIDKFQGAFQQLSTTTLNSNFLKGLIDGGTTALEVITQLIDQFGILQIAISGLALGKGISSFVKGFDRSAYMIS